jgi:hypothetical protein
LSIAAEKSLSEISALAGPQNTSALAANAISEKEERVLIFI